MPIHLRTTSAPLQPIPLYNDSSLPLHFTITILPTPSSPPPSPPSSSPSSPFLVSPLSGTIDACSRHTATVRFRPTQLRLYHLHLLVTTTSTHSEAREHHLTLQGEGVLPSSPLLPLPSPPLPPFQSVLRPHQLARLSTDALVYGGLCPGSAVSRVFVLESVVQGWGWRGGWGGRAGGLGWGVR